VRREIRVQSINSGALSRRARKMLHHLVPDTRANLQPQKALIRTARGNLAIMAREHAILYSRFRDFNLN